MRELESTASQAAKQPDSEGTLRTELAGKLAGAQNAIATQVSDLTASGADPALLAQLREQLTSIAALQDNVATALPAALASLRAEVRNTVAASASLAGQASAVLSASTSAAQANLAATSATLRQELASAHAALFERRVFDPFLTFASAADETAYREREEQTRRYIEQQRAAGTPEGELNAAGATMGQMLDAHAHGGGKSAEFLPQWTRLAEATERHREALRAEGRSTDEFDRNLTVSVRRYLKEKGLSEAEIDAALAASANPLEAVKPYLKSNADQQELSQQLTAMRRQDETPIAPITIAVAAPVTDQPSVSAISPIQAPDLADVMATFRAAGVTASGPSGATTEVVGQATPRMAFKAREKAPG